MDAIYLTDFLGYLCGLLAVFGVPLYAYLHLTNRARLARGVAEMPDQQVMTVYQDRRECPQCGSPLCTNGSLVWCSDIGGGEGRTACMFGITEKVSVDDPRLAPREAQS